MNAIADKRILSSFEVGVTHQRDDYGTDGVNNQVPHGVDNAGFAALHVQIRRNLIGREFKNLPNHTQKDRKSHAEEAPECRAQRLGQRSVWFSK